MLGSNIKAIVGFTCWAGLVAAAMAQTSPPLPHGPVRSRGVIILPADPATPQPVVPQPASPSPSPPPSSPPPGSINAIDSSRPVPKPAAVIKACNRPFAHPDLHLDDPATFRAALAAALRPGRIVVVDLPAPYHADKTPPDALAPWLSEVRSSGGSVTTSAYCQQGRGAFGGFLSRLFGTQPDPGRAYRPARRYDVVLHLDALDQVVTQIEFRPRAARPS